MVKDTVIASINGEFEKKELRDAIRKIIGREPFLVGSTIVINSCSITEGYRISMLPGVRWVAVGKVEKKDNLPAIAVELAANYLTKRRTFMLYAERDSPEEVYDMKIKIEGDILSKLKNKKINEKKPDVVFVLTKQDNQYAFGVKIYDGVGGIIQSKERIASCLVSGGIHSSVLSWFCCLSGYSLKMIHCYSGTYALYSVAKLYEKISSMSNPEMLELELVYGKSKTENLLFSLVQESKTALYSGNHSSCSGEVFFERVQAPLFFMPEELFISYSEKLGIKDKSKRLEKTKFERVNYKTKSFGFRKANMHEVIDKLTSNLI